MQLLEKRLSENVLILLLNFPGTLRILFKNEQQFFETECRIFVVIFYDVSCLSMKMQTIYFKPHLLMPTIVLDLKTMMISNAALIFMQIKSFEHDYILDSK